MFFDRDMSDAELQNAESISTRPPTHAESGVVGCERASSSDESDQPTCVPSFDVNAMAEAAFRVQGTALPFDMAVPARCASVEVGHLDLRAVFLLLHIDGRSSIAEIATMTAISTTEAQKRIRELVALGVVTIDGMARVEVDVPPASMAPATLDTKR